jgi:MFS family permease
MPRTTQAQGAGFGNPWTAFTPRQRWSALAVLFLVGAASYMDRSILQILLEPIRREFHLSDTALGLLGGAPFALCFALSSLPLAALADRIGSKKVLVAALLLWSACTAACGLAPTLLWLVIARMGVGLGEGGASPPAHALIAHYFPPDLRARAYALHTLSATIGILIAAAGGSFIAATYGWRSAFVAVAAFSLPVLMLALVVLREPKNHRASPEKTTPLAGFLALLHIRSFRIGLLGFLAYALVSAGPLVFVPTYMVRTLGVDLKLAGSYFGIATAIGAIIGSLGGGWIADRLARRDPRWLFWLPAAGLALAFPLAAGIFIVSNLATLLALLLCLATLIYAALPPFFAGVQVVCGPERRATATAMVFIALNGFGAALGPLMTGALSDALTASFGPQSLRIACLMMTGWAIPASLFMLLASNLLRHELLDRPELGG